MSMRTIAITKKCNCDINNWIKHRTNSRLVNSSVLVQCTKCNAQWYSKAKYTKELPFSKTF